MPFVYRLLPVLVAAAVLVGCEAAVDPVLGTERPYTLYGFLDPSADTQAVRVVPIEGRLALETGAPLDAVVTLAGPAGLDRVLADSVVRFDDGRFGHVYWTRLRPDYVVRARRPDGAEATVRVAVPPLVQPVVDPGVTTVAGLTVPVRWPGAPRLNQVVVHYLLSDDLPLDSVAFDYAGQAVEVPGGWSVPVRLTQDARDVSIALVRAAGGPVGVPVRLCEVKVDLLVSSADWAPPGGVYDPELLVEPGTFSNVENGFGFVGGGYGSELRFRPTDEQLRAVGFSTLPCDDEGDGDG